MDTPSLFRDSSHIPHFLNGVRSSNLTIGPSSPLHFKNKTDIRSQFMESPKVDFEDLNPNSQNESRVDRNSSNISGRVPVG